MNDIERMQELKDYLSPNCCRECRFWSLTVEQNKNCVLLNQFRQGSDWCEAGIRRQITKVLDENV